MASTGPPVPGGCAEATLRVLTVAERVDTPLGRAALAMATKVDDPAVGAAALAALSKQLGETLSAVLAGTEVQGRLAQLRALRNTERPG